MDLRHEIKIEISPTDRLILRQRLRAVMQADPNAMNGRYSIRSLYFDTPTDKALREKLDGVNVREKFRIRCYNGNTDFIRLEKKSKFAGLGNKQDTILTAEQTDRLLNGDLSWMPEQGGLVLELYEKMKTQLLAPKVIVEYTREPYVYSPGNVRVTMDDNIRTGTSVRQFLRQDCLTVPAGDSPILLEVKWDSFLPSHIRSAVQLGARNSGAFSKYAQCRIYG